MARDYIIMNCMSSLMVLKETLKPENELMMVMIVCRHRTMRMSLEREKYSSRCWR